MSKIYQIPMRDADNPYHIRLIQVSEAVYRDVMREIWRIRKKAQRHGQCVCPESYLCKCDGNCELCEYQTAGDKLSLDCETETNGDYFRDIYAVDEEVIRKITMSEMLKLLEELMPEAIAVGKLAETGLSERESLKQLGLKRSTYRSKLKRTKSQIEAEYGKIF